MNLVDMNIVDRRLKSIAEEMGIVLMKTSYSTIFNNQDLRTDKDKHLNYHMLKIW